MIKWPAALLVMAVTVWLWVATVDRSPRANVWGVYRVSSMPLNMATAYAALCTLYLLLGGGRARVRFFRLMLPTMACVCVVALVEIPAVVFGYNYEDTFGTAGDSTWLNMSSSVNQPDPELLFVHWPHSGYQGEVVGNLCSLGIPQSTTYPVDLHYDQHGFRNDVDYEQADMVVIGDSFVEGALVAQKDTVVQLLGRQLSRTVVNLGQASYGLKQELIVLKRYGLPLSPQIVFWFFFGGNDLRDVAWYEWAHTHSDEFRAPRPLRSRLFVRNSLLALSKWTTPPRKHPSAVALNQSGLFTLADGTTERIYFGQTNGPWKPEPWKVLTATIGEANRICRERGMEFVVVYVSRKFRIYQSFLTFEPGSLAGRWDVNDLPETLGRWCNQQNIHYVNTVPPMIEAVSRGEHAYFVDDVHWNARGHAVAAKTIVDYLASMGWTKETKGR